MSFTSRTIPGSLGLPIIGETIQFLTDRDFAKKRQAKYGQIFRTHIFGRPTVILSGAEANKFLLTNENKYFIATWPASVKTLLGPASLAVKTGDFHSSRRRLMYQAFLPRALASYIPSIVKITEEYCQRWQEMKELTWYPELRNYTLDIACKLLVGFDRGSQTLLGHAFENWCEGLFTLPINLPWTKFGKALKSREILLEEIEKIIVNYKGDNNEGKTALEILINAVDEEGQKLSLEELKDQILLLLFAGHETLTSALASFCLLTAQHPSILEQLREEQKQFQLGENLSLDTLKEMTYLDMVIKETLRYTPPVGGGFRKIIQDCEYGGYKLQEGWALQYQITNTHKNPDIYPQPDVFDPSRFAGDKNYNYGYVPFGGGVRECLGKEFARLEMKIFAAYLLQHNRWEILPGQDLNLITIPTPRPADGLKVRFY